MTCFSDALNIDGHNRLIFKEKIRRFIDNKVCCKFGHHINIIILNIVCNGFMQIVLFSTRKYFDRHRTS